MKFYNPFKPHIVTIGDTYAVRQFSCMFIFFQMWKYRDTTDDYWWYSPAHVKRYSIFSSLDSARGVLRKLKPVVLPEAEYLES